MTIERNQAWPFRVEIMQEIIKSAFSTPINALEIGVWFGVGSTKIWLDNVKPGSTIVLVDPWKPYASKADLEDDLYDYKKMDDLSTDAFLSTYLNIKNFEDSSKDRDIKISMIRGDSSVTLPLLQADTFDFIYIDGDHKYENVRNDIRQAKRLVRKSFGIICGDDLEKLPTQELVALASANKERDYERSKKFHPGVLLAVAEEFETVNMFNGFWWIACRDGIFDPSIGRLG